MLDGNGVRNYWEDQTKKGDNPCHYHNKWQDLYAFKVRTGAFRKEDFYGAEEVVDVGCGIGEYTTVIAQLTDAHFTAFDFPFNIEIALKQYPNHPQITFKPYVVPDEKIKEAIREADRVFTTTVYVHFSGEAKNAFYSYVETMRLGSRVMLLEYIPYKIPEFQKGLAHKHVETQEEIAQKFEYVGFHLLEVRHVNFIDSFLFFHIGKNYFTYVLTRIVERLLHVVGYQKSKYKLLVFEKK